MRFDLEDMEGLTTDPMQQLQGQGYYEEKEPASEEEATHEKIFKQFIEKEDYVQAFLWCHQVIILGKYYSHALPFWWQFIKFKNNVRNLPAVAANIQKILNNPALLTSAEIAFKGCFYYLLDRDFERALREFNLASGKNNSLALAVLGCMHWRGEGVPQNRDRAIQYIDDALRLKNKFSMILFGRDFDDIAALQEMRLNLAQTHFLKMVERYRFLFTDAAWRLSLSFFYYTQLIELGNVDAMVALARRLSNDAEKIVLLEKACMLQSTIAYFLLGNIYFDRKDYAKAKQYYESVVRIRNDPKAMCFAIYMIATMHANGLGVDNNKQLAIYLYDLVATEMHTIINFWCFLPNLKQIACWHWENDIRPYCDQRLLERLWPEMRHHHRYLSPKLLKIFFDSPVTIAHLFNQDVVTLECVFTPEHPLQTLFSEQQKKLIYDRLSVLRINKLFFILMLMDSPLGRHILALERVLNDQPGNNVLQHFGWKHDIINTVFSFYRHKEIYDDEKEQAIAPYDPVSQAIFGYK